MPHGRAPPCARRQPGLAVPLSRAPVVPPRRGRAEHAQVHRILKAGAVPAGLGLHPFFVRDPDSELAFGRPRCGSATRRCLPTERVAVPNALGLRRPRARPRRRPRQLFRRLGRPRLITWPGRRLRLELQASAPFRHAVVYTPANQPFFCVEPVSHANGKIAENFSRAGCTPAATSLSSLGPVRSHAALRLLSQPQGSPGLRVGRWLRHRRRRSSSTLPGRAPRWRSSTSTKRHPRRWSARSRRPAIPRHCSPSATCATSRPIRRSSRALPPAPDLSRAGQQRRARRSAHARGGDARPSGTSASPSTCGTSTSPSSPWRRA